MEKTISVATTIRRMFKIYTDSINYIYSLNFTTTQKAILSELLYQNYLLKDTPAPQRYETILSTSSRTNMIRYLKINRGTFNNTLTVFRSAKGQFGSILTGIEINESYMIYPSKDDINTISIKLVTKINKDNVSTNNQ